jgi:DNA repair photolyase
MDEVPDRPRKGRGAVSNPGGRFEPLSRAAVDDGWEVAEEDPPPLRTVVRTDTSRTVIARNDSPDVPFDRSINPYRGCEHGCVYCFARPTHAYLGLSPGLDFETRLFAKDDAPALLERELRRPGYEPRPIMLGANTDPYQPVERDREITRGILRVLDAFNHPVAIATKSVLVCRDLDILAPMAARGLASVGVSVTTLDHRLARTMEPRAATPARRLEAITRLSEAGVPVSVLAAPMIPGLNDAELESILKASARAGAGSAAYILLRLPLELKDLFTEWLRAHVPNRAERVLGLMRESRGGRLYVAEFGSRMRGTGVHAELLEKRFELACRRLGLRTARPPEAALETGLFSPPPTAGDQLTLL